MTKTLVIVLGVAIGAALVFFMFGKDTVSEFVATDECPAGYEVVGEGCMTHEDACELQGDDYSFDEMSEECVKQGA